HLGLTQRQGPRPLLAEDDPEIVGMGDEVFYECLDPFQDRLEHITASLKRGEPARVGMLDDLPSAFGLQVLVNLPLPSRIRAVDRADRDAGFLRDLPDVRACEATCCKDALRPPPDGGAVRLGTQLPERRLPRRPAGHRGCPYTAGSGRGRL